MQNFYKENEGGGDGKVMVPQSYLRSFKIFFILISIFFPSFKSANNQYLFGNKFIITKVCKEGVLTF